jgi:hypothetical protein
LVEVPEISFDFVEPVPVRLAVTSPIGQALNHVGATTQLVATALLPDGTSQDVTSGVAGTNYTISNPAIATISPDGLVTAVSSGTVLVTAMNDGATGMIRLQVVTSSDSDGDGIPDDVELANGMNPNDPVDALEDFDRDGLINRDEIAQGTGLRNADSDDDGLLDGREVERGTDPLVADTDGDGVADGLEVQTGSDPLDANSLNLAQALLSISTAPGSLNIVYNTVMGEASRRIAVTGALRDGRSIDLTSLSRGTVYQSADLTIANFGGDAGEVFAGQNGSTTITVNNSGYTAIVPVTVTSFSPTALSFLAIPGYANNVDVAGDFAYVAAGSAGLHVVDITDRRNPRIVGSLDTPGVGIDVRVVGSLAYLADGTSGLSVINVSNPTAPSLVGRVDTPGDAQDLVVRDGVVYVADGPEGLAIIDARSPAAPVILAQIDTPGVARGVDVTGTLAVLADGPVTIRTIDVSSPTAPVLRGSVTLPGDVKDLVVKDQFAYVAAYSPGSLQVVDVSNPAVPVVAGSTPGFVPRDVELFGGLGFAAEQLFPNAVPILAMSPADAPVFRTTLDFAPLGDYAGTGIAADESFVYMTGAFFFAGSDYGTTGNTRLFIGQYLDLQDDLGVPPTVSVIEPAAGSTVYSGQTVKLRASAVDDIAVTSVTFRVDGIPVGTDRSAPYEVSYVVPAGLSTISLSATALDPGNNEGASSSIDLQVASDPDPPTAALITTPVLDQIVSGTAPLAATASDALSGVDRIEVRSGAMLVATLRGPSFSQPWYSAVLSDGPHSLVARAFDRVGNAGPVGPAVSIVINNVALAVSLTSPSAGSAVRDAVAVSATTNHIVDRVDFEAGSVFGSSNSVPYSATLDVSGLPEGIVDVQATAFSAGGESAIDVVQIVIDRTPPSAPDLSKIVAEALAGGAARVTGGPGAAEAGATVEATNLASGAVVTVTSAADGSFLAALTATLGETLSIVIVDRAGNRSLAGLVVVQPASNIGGIPTFGMTLWVNAGVGVTTDGSGLVTNWADQSGMNNHFTQPSVTNQPTYVANGFNGQPVLRFDGSNDFVRLAVPLPDIQSVFWVVKEDPAAPAAYRSLLGHPTLRHFEGAPAALWRSDTCCTSSNVQDGQTWVNGAMINGMTTPRPKEMSVISLITTGSVNADRFGTSVVSPWWGDLAELIIYDRPLSASERQSVEDYLVRKYRPYSPRAGVPAISPAGGVFGSSISVTLATSTPDADIYYTTDGSSPNPATSPRYTSAIVLTENTTLRAMAVRPGFADSATAIATFLREGSSAPPLNGPLATGLALWLRADAGLATDGGDWVTRWEDQSGRANHATQSIGVKAPLFAREGMNDLPTVRFDGLDDSVSFTAPISTIRSVFWVVKESAAATSAYRSLLGHSTLRHFEGSPTAIWRSDTCCTSAAVQGGQTWLNGQPVDGRATSRPRTLSVISLVTTGPVTADRFGSASAASPWWGDLAELLIYDRVLDPLERRQVEDFLISKYEIGATVTPPLVSPGGGSFTGSLEVSLQGGTPGAYITYTTDGSEPMVTSALYAGPITLTATTTLKARAFRDDLAPSSTVTAVFEEDSQFQPRNVAGMTLWLRADAGAPSGFGDLWLDQSGANNHATQTDGNSVPRIVPDAGNGLPAMRFDGAADFVRFPEFQTIRTVFWVVREDSAASSAYRSLLGHSSLRHFEGSLGAPGPIWRSDTCCTSSFVQKGQTWLNGVPVDGRTTPRPRILSVISLVTTGPVTADRFGTSVVAPWWGDLAELLIYDQALDPVDRRRVEDYLLSKYAIGGPVTPPLVSPPGGVFSGTQAVVLSTGTPGATVRYTLDGTEPSAGSDAYLGEISLSTTTTLKARAFHPDRLPSATVTVVFDDDSRFQPRDISGLSLWLRADAGAPTGFGDLWSDQSTLGNHAGQTDGNAIPRLLQDAVNGRPAMRFDGSADFVLFPSLDTIRTVFWVVREDPAASSANRSLLGHGSLRSFEGGLGAPGTIWRSDTCCTSALVQNGQTWLNGQAIEGRSTLRPRTMAIISLVTDGSVTADRFGATAVVSPWWGDLAELIVYDRPLSDAERISVEDYLNAKYSLLVR